MSDDTILRMMELAGKRYCCTQIMLLLSQQDMGRENPDLIRAAAGLCKGLGDCSGPCGVLTGAACVLGLHAGMGTDDEETDERLQLMQEELGEWFSARCAEFGSTACQDILGGECGGPDPARCGGLMNEAHAKVYDILMENGFDPAQGREPA